MSSKAGVNDGSISYGTDCDGPWNTSNWPRLCWIVVKLKTGTLGFENPLVRARALTLLDLVEEIRSQRGVARSVRKCP